VTDPEYNNTLDQAIKTAFLDRDGVLNEKMQEGNYVTCWAEFRLLQGVAEAIRRLNRAGVRVIVVSNQRGIALGLYTAADVEAIHSSLQKVLQTQGAQIDDFFFCPHDKGQCNCRKPMPGLFEQAIVKYPEITADSSIMIGDSLSDVEFGQRLGIKTVFVDNGSAYHQKPGSSAARQLANRCAASLSEAVDWMLQKPTLA